MAVPLRKRFRNRATGEEAVLCLHCGEQNRADARFCRACGSDLQVPDAAAEHPEPQPEGLLHWVAARKRLVAAVVVTVAIIAAIGVAALRSSDDPAATSFVINSTLVRRMRLVAVRALDGEVVARGEGPPVLTRLSGTITDIAPEGSRIERGEALYSIDGLPVLLLYGGVPAWRDIGGADASEGVDVRQLEVNLKALGFDPGTVDEEYTATTRAAVASWLESHGLPAADAVRLGRVFFARSAIAVSKHLKGTGAPVGDGDEIMSTVSSEKVLSVNLRSKNELAPGDEVSIVLPGRKVKGTVVSVETRESNEPGVESVTQATVVPETLGALAAFGEGADVDVEVLGEARDNVLVVPVTALVARRDGGYAVEVVHSGGRTEFVLVTPGLFSSNLVEVSGELEEGDRVVVP